MVTTLAEHSVDISLLKPDSLILDVGCRAFTFTNEILKYVDNVTAVDADPIVHSKDPRVKVYNLAIGSGLNGPATFIKFGNGTGNYLHKNGYEYPASYGIDYPPLFTLEAFSKYVDVAGWDLVKLDIEGAEFDVLMEMKYPLARQISVEFHQHTQARRTPTEMTELVVHLSQWYSISGMNLVNMHGAGYNYWDVLLKLK